MLSKNITILFLVTLIGLQLVPSTEAGVKQFFKDALHKVKSLFNCDSHETDDEHLKAIGNETTETTVNTIEGIGETESTTELEFNIDIRNKDTENAAVGPKAIIAVPSNCPQGQRMDHSGKCQEIL